MATKLFKGMNVFMSRSLVPPELFDALHDALKLNGAQVFLFCDPSRNGPNDYHVISSPEHEMFEYLRSKGCNLIGPDLENLLPNITPTSKLENKPPADKQSEGDDLYLSECTILLLGFEASELRKLVDMVRRGGGSRYVSVRDKLTHVVVGNPSESEIQEVTSLAAFGVINVVKRVWLEECTLKKKEVPVLQSHIAYNLLLPKDSVIFNKASTRSMAGLKPGKSSASQLVANDISGNRNFQSYLSLGLNEEAKLKVHSTVSNGIKDIKPCTVFKGKLFRFSSSFPEEQRPEIVLWVNKGGGVFVEDENGKTVHFIVERHGAARGLTNTASMTYITTHWIHSCLEDGCLLDISSHVLYSPLSCKIPLPGLEGYCICVSQYDMKERQLLRNLCYVLGVKYVEKLTNKVTHLLCKFADGDKYEAACRWGIHVVTAEWIYACAMQNKVVDLKGFYPKELSFQDRRVGSYSMSQYPTHSDKITSGDDASQQPSQAQDLSNMHMVNSTAMGIDEDNYSSGSKRARILGNDHIKHSLTRDSIVGNFLSRTHNIEKNVTENSREVSSVVPDLAAAIEDLLEQTIKYISSKPTMGQRHADLPSDPGPSKYWTNTFEKREDKPSSDTETRGSDDDLSESQSDSQLLVGYEDDLSGRQRIIDRVRRRNSEKEK